MKKTLYMAFLVIAAIVLGGLLSSAVSGAAALSWLSYAKRFSFEPGTFLNFDVLQLTFGITFTISVAQILLIGICLFIYYKTAAKLFPGK